MAALQEFTYTFRHALGLTRDVTVHATNPRTAEMLAWLKLGGRAVVHAVAAHRTWVIVGATWTVAAAQVVEEAL